MQLTGLEPLYEDMIRNNRDRVAFAYRNNKAILEIIFMIDLSPFALLITARGVRPFSFELPVTYPGFSIDAYLGKAYGELLDALGVESNPSNRFSTRAFFEDLNAHIPSEIGRTTRPTPAQAARRQIDIEESDKIYFVGWVDHPNGRHVTAANLHKTRELIGQREHDHCARLNISSRWSADWKESKEIGMPGS